jgi:hypothetical protein
MLREDKESFSLNQLWVISGPTKYGLQANKLTPIAINQGKD